MKPKKVKKAPSSTGIDKLKRRRSKGNVLHNFTYISHTNHALKFLGIKHQRAAVAPDGPLPIPAIRLEDITLEQLNPNLYAVLPVHDTLAAQNAWNPGVQPHKTT